MSWFRRLKEGLSKTSGGISGGIGEIFTKRRLDEAMLEELEELLIAADMGAATAAQVVAEFGQGRFDKEIAPEEVKAELARLIGKRLEPVAVPLSLHPSTLPPEGVPPEGGQHPDAAAARDIRPHVLLVVGVNGNGKTTTIGKLAHWLQTVPSPDGKAAGRGGNTILLAAADTFRAAAVEQLQIWGERTGCAVITGAAQADPASVAYQALERAQAQGADALLIDTAGRLQNKANLMAELSKIVKVLKKRDPDAPHRVIQVLDATTGQNALSQVQAFTELVNVTGLVVTKLDGTAKAGVVVALAERFGLPIHAIGVGEGVDDLQPFDPYEFARGLVGN